jgi:hypothetical protein
MTLSTTKHLKSESAVTVTFDNGDKMVYSIDRSKNPGIDFILAPGSLVAYPTSKDFYSVINLIHYTHTSWFYNGDFRQAKIEYLATALLDFKSFADLVAAKEIRV